MQDGISTNLDVLRLAVSLVEMLTSDWTAEGVGAGMRWTAKDRAMASTGLQKSTVWLKA